MFIFADWMSTAKTTKIACPLKYSVIQYLQRGITHMIHHCVDRWLSVLLTFYPVMIFQFKSVLLNENSPGLDYNCILQLDLYLAT